MEKVSILIPCFNNEEWIEQAIDSALSQTYSEIEVIVVDDGSTDSSLGKILKYDSRITHEAGPNRGGNFARNRLLQLADGEWIQYLDADDALGPEKVASQMALVGEGIDAVYGKILVEHWNGDNCVSTQISDPSEHGDIYSQWLNWKLAQTGSVLWRKQSLINIGGWNEAYKCCQDNEICMRALKNGLRFQFSEDTGTVYRLWSSGTVSKKNPDLLLTTIVELTEQMVAWLGEEKLLQRVHMEAAGKQFFRLSRTCAATDFEKAVELANEMSRKGLFTLDPTVAPLVYRLLYQVFGFKFAESIAKWTRK